DRDEPRRGHHVLPRDGRFDRDEAVLRGGGLLRRRRLLREYGASQREHEHHGSDAFHHHSSAARYSASSSCRRFSSSVRSIRITVLNSRNATTQNQNVPRMPGCSVGITEVFGWSVRQTLTDQYTNGTFPIP